jgi:hypothetical protein
LERRGGDQVDLVEIASGTSPSARHGRPALKGTLAGLTRQYGRWILFGDLVHFLQLALRSVPELVVTTCRLSRLLPKLTSANSYLDHLWDASSPASIASSFLTAAAELPTFSTMMRSSSMLIPSLCAQHFTSFALAT